MLGFLSTSSNCPSPMTCIDAAQEEIFTHLSWLEIIYPEFRTWFFDKVAVASATDSRAVFLHRRYGKIVGVGLAKRTAMERKLCTLWVAPEARLEGIGAIIAAEAFDWLGTSTPLFTVPQERLEEFRGLLNQWRFKRTEKLCGYYKADGTEHVFNGSLRPTSCS